MNEKDHYNVDRTNETDEASPSSETEDLTAAESDNATAQADADEGRSQRNGHETEADTTETEATEDVSEEASPEELAETIARLESDLAEANQKADQYLDQMQRTAAEFQNARRRQERQVQQSIERATEGVIRRLLPILDDFELAFDKVPQSLDGEELAWIQGFERIQDKLRSILTEAGVEPIETEGEFDPSRHEAVTNEPSDEVESGHIIETLRTGYEYKDVVLRPALVRVAQ